MRDLSIAGLRGSRPAANLDEEECRCGRLSPLHQFNPRLGVGHAEGRTLQAARPGHRVGLQKPPPLRPKQYKRRVGGHLSDLLEKPMDPAVSPPPAGCYCFGRRGGCFRLAYESGPERWRLDVFHKHSCSTGSTDASSLRGFDEGWVFSTIWTIHAVLPYPYYIFHLFTDCRGFQPCR
jgi:hypothetical protein